MVAQDVVVIDGFTVFSGFTGGPTNIVAMGLAVVLWSSSHSTIRRLLLFFAHVAYAIGLKPFPVLMVCRV